MVLLVIPIYDKYVLKYLKRRKQMDRWLMLIKQFEENGYKPHDIQHIVMLYEMMQESDQLLKEAMEKEHERTNQD
jgi:DNA-binding transcriptional MerR regulator